jgi:hypothetical protein
MVCLLLVGYTVPHGEAPFGTNKKGHLGHFQVSFFNAYGVSCRARAEEAGPTSIVGDSPLIGSPVAAA